MPPSRRSELVDVAMQVFHRHGFHASGIDSILTQSCISRMTLYNHFKSKDDLIVAALRRRDEISRERLTTFVATHARTPEEKVLAVFDYHEQWFASPDFCGCLFINAAAEFGDAHSLMRQVSAEHKLAVVAYLADLCRQCGIAHPQEIAEQLNMLLEGATVTAQVVGQVVDGGKDPGASARLAKKMASRMLLMADRA